MDRKSKLEKTIFKCQLYKAVKFRERISLCLFAKNILRAKAPRRKEQCSLQKSPPNNLAGRVESDTDFIESAISNFKRDKQCRSFARFTVYIHRCVMTI